MQLSISTNSANELNAKRKRSGLKLSALVACFPTTWGSSFIGNLSSDHTSAATALLAKGKLTIHKTSSYLQMQSHLFMLANKNTFSINVSEATLLLTKGKFTIHKSSP